MNIDNDLKKNLLMLYTIQLNCGVEQSGSSSGS